MGLHRLYYPIIVNPDKEILDGHHRNQICLDLGIKPKYKIRESSDPLSERAESNLDRRHLTTLRKIEMALPLMEIEKEKGKAKNVSWNPCRIFGKGLRKLSHKG